MSVPISSTIQAAVLILAREIFRALGIRPESVEEICDGTGTSRSQAYEMVGRVKQALGHVHRQPGRPPNPAAGETAASRVLMAVRNFLMDNPGCVETRGTRRVYHGSYREFVLGQLAPGGPAATLTHEQAARLVGVPLGTLKDWLAIPKARRAHPSVRIEAAEIEATAEPPCVEVADPGIALILDRFPAWKGSFEGFCRFLQREHRLSRGRTFISTVLEMAGLRRPRRRGRQQRPWSLERYLKLFPGAQWIGDGKKLIIDWLGQKMGFNLELLVDPASDAAVGITVTDTEDEEAVLAAHDQALVTTGAAPLAVTLDQRPSNHTERVRDAVSPAELLASTKARPTAKAPVEGAFGLFSQAGLPLVVAGQSPREQARSALSLIVLGWFLGRNGRPRSRLGGLSPAAAYQQAQPTEEEIAQARDAIAELKRREEASRQTLEAKADPVRRQILRENLQALGITDPEGRLATRLAASYSQEAILQGLAIFRSKRQLGTLPPELDPGPYLAGIIGNVHAQLEDTAMADALLDLRLRHRELSLSELERAAARIVGETASPYGQCRAVLERAVQAEALVDFRFWLRRLGQVAQDTAAVKRRAIYDLLSRRVVRAYDTPRDRRRQLLATLSAAAVAGG